MLTILHTLLKSNKLQQIEGKIALVQICIGYDLVTSLVVFMIGSAIDSLLFSLGAVTYYLSLS